MATVRNNRRSNPNRVFAREERAKNSNKFPRLPLNHTEPYLRKLEGLGML